MNKIDKAACAASPVFVANGWTWGFDPNEHIPTAVEIAAGFKRLLSTVQGKDLTGSECGRLMVQKNTELGYYEFYLNLGHVPIKESHD